MKDLTPKDKKSGPSLYLRLLRFLEKISKKKFIIKFSITTLILAILIFPTTTGDLIGTWYHKITQAFIDATK